MIKCEIGFINKDKVKYKMNLINMKKYYYE